MHHACLVFKQMVSFPGYFNSWWFSGDLPGKALQREGTAVGQTSYCLVSSLQIKIKYVRIIQVCYSGKKQHVHDEAQGRKSCKILMFALKKIPNKALIPQSSIVLTVLVIM